MPTLILSREQLQRAAALIFVESCQARGCGHPGCEERHALAGALEREAMHLPPAVAFARVEPFTAPECTFLRCPIPRRCKADGCLCIRPAHATQMELEVVPFFADAEEVARA